MSTLENVRWDDEMRYTRLIYGARVRSKKCVPNDTHAACLDPEGDNRVYWVHNCTILHVLLIYGVMQPPRTNMAQNSTNKTQIK